MAQNGRIHFRNRVRLNLRYSPAIANKKVVLAAIAAVADELDCVVDGGAVGSDPYEVELHRVGLRCMFAPVLRLAELPNAAQDILSALVHTFPGGERGVGGVQLVR